MARPEDRYEKLETKTLANGTVVYKPARPKAVDVHDNDITIDVNERDRMDVIANNMYGTPLDWWKIAAANHLTNGSLHITPGTKITIPKD
jgi:nucleoid-associated protein YgaU